MGRHIKFVSGLAMEGGGGQRCKLEMCVLLMKVASQRLFRQEKTSSSVNFIPMHPFSQTASVPV